MLGRRFFFIRLFFAIKNRLFSVKHPFFFSDHDLVSLQRPFFSCCDHVFDMLRPYFSVQNPNRAVFKLSRRYITTMLGAAVAMMIFFGLMRKVRFFVTQPFFGRAAFKKKKSFEPRPKKAVF